MPGVGSATHSLETRENIDYFVNDYAAYMKHSSFLPK
jgi:hypothetical protein